MWLEDAHYNADKFNTQRLHTFVWDNLEFDGPVLPRDLGFDVADNHVADDSTQAGASVSAADTGYFVAANASRTLTVPGVTGVGDAAGALLVFNYTASTAPATLTVAVNGHTITVPAASRTLGVPVPLSDITTGDNTVTFTAGNYGLNVMNISLIMKGAGGVVPPSGGGSPGGGSPVRTCFPRRQFSRRQLTRSHTPGDPEDR